MADNLIRNLAGLSRAVVDKTYPWIASRKGLTWSPSATAEDSTEPGRFVVPREAFEILGMLRRSTFFLNLCANIPYLGQEAPRPLLECHLGGDCEPHSMFLSRVEALACFLESLPSSHHIFDQITLILPSSPESAILLWRTILPLCRTPKITICTVSDPPDFIPNIPSLAFGQPHIELPILKSLYISALGFSDTQWHEALRNIRCPSLNNFAIGCSTVPAAALAGFLSRHPNLERLKCMDSIGRASRATYPELVHAPRLSSVSGSLDHVAPLLRVLQPPPPVKFLYFDTVKGISYRSWVEEVLRCLPSKDTLLGLEIGYEGVLSSAGEGFYQPVLAHDCILPRRLRHHQQSKLITTRIKLHNVFETEVKVIEFS